MAAVAEQATEGKVPMHMQRQMRRLTRNVRSKSEALINVEGLAASCKSATCRSNGTQASFGLDSEADTLAIDAGPAHFEKTLNSKPEDRDPASVRLALEWWLRNLPISGSELAPELQAENWVLFETFLCGRLATFSRNQVIQEEGEEVKHYSIILFGQCKLRCAKPAVAVAPIVPVVDTGKEDAKGRDADAFINIETLGRGEAIGLYPGDPRSPYNVVCSDRTMILRLTPQDYEGTLKPFHREHITRTVEFLQQHNICPEANAVQLRKIAPFLRQRRIPRGRIFIHSGECQRHLYFLREGSCSVLVHDSPAMAAPVDEEEDEDDGEDEDKHGKFLQLRASSYGARMQQSAAYDNQRSQIVKSMARGPLKKTLAGHTGPAFKLSDGNLHSSATLSDPGMMMGEEAFAHDNFRDWVNLRNCYSVRAAQSCSFFVADICAFKLLITYRGTAGLHMLNDKMSRRVKQFTRAKNVTNILNKRAQDMKANELAKLSRQQLRLPRCAGYPAVDELENVEDYLDVVFEHRKPPPNTQLPTLTILEGTGYGPNAKDKKAGPGVTSMLQALGEDGTLRRSRSSFRFSEFRDESSYDENPMGGTVSADARYDEALLPGQERGGGPLSLTNGASPKALLRSETMPEVTMGGVFLNTEVEFDDGMTFRVESQTMTTSKSLPNIFSPKTQMNPVPKRQAPPSPYGIAENELPSLEEDAALPSRKDIADAERKRHQRVMKAFNRAMPGKSVLILTDKKEIKKQITRVLLNDGTAVSFIKTSNDLWTRLRDGKEHYDILLIDLTKNDLQIEPLLRTIRQGKSSQMPVVVLSLDRDLPEVVRTCCSFVVFLPLAAQMLREALVWCFDRKSVQQLFQTDDMQQDMSQEWPVLRGKASTRRPDRTLADESR